MTCDYLLDEKDAATSSKFTDLTDSLLPHFSDSGAHGDRRWEEVFGIVPANIPEPGGIQFSVSVRRRSSSGS